MQVDSFGAWEVIWGGVTALLPGLPVVLTLLAVVLLAAALGNLFLELRRVIGAGHNLVFLMAGLVALAPHVLIPIALLILDAFLNIIYAILSRLL